MVDFTVHDEQTAPEQSRSMLAESPELLAGNNALYQQFLTLVAARVPPNTLC